jgi:hypothetical protein
VETVSQKFVLNKDDSNVITILDNLIEFLRGLPLSRSWMIEIKRYVKTRSNEQNAALWGVAYPAIVAATGEDDVNTWHEYFLGERFGWVEVSLFGKRKLRPARTTTTGYKGEDNPLSTIEFAEFYDFIQRRARENGIKVPDPDPLWFRNKHERDRDE